MFYKTVIRDQVHDDIQELADYVFRMSFSKDISRKIYDNLYKRIFSLNFMPHRFEIYVWEYRRIVVDGSYKILYRVDEEKKKVIIVRVVRTEMEKIDT